MYECVLLINICHPDWHIEYADYYHTFYHTFGLYLSTEYLCVCDQRLVKDKHNILHHVHDLHERSQEWISYFFSNTFITSGKPQSEVKTHKE